MNASCAMSSTAAASWTTSHAARYARGQCSANSPSNASARTLPAPTRPARNRQARPPASDPWLRLGSGPPWGLFLPYASAGWPPRARLPQSGHGPIRPAPGGWLPPQAPARPAEPAAPPADEPRRPGPAGVPERPRRQPAAITALVLGILGLLLVVLTLGAGFLFSLPLDRRGSPAGSAPQAGPVGQTTTGEGSPTPGSSSASSASCSASVGMIVWVALIAAGLDLDELQRDLEQRSSGGARLAATLGA